MRRFDAAQAPETHAILGAAIEVQRDFGTGLLESAYGDALEMEMTDRGIPHRREVAVPLFYKGRQIRTCYRADFVCHGRIVLELKASVGLGNADQAQMWHYLAATGLDLGFLLNFGHAPMQIRRFVRGDMQHISVDSVDSVAG
ncbi:MAG TPA: GxxExxY protein [Candidatus Thermoplasmatota archaeon]|nr:GxxExxY protein [Candidatus Thermoplasmatota archaeon]